MTLACFGDDQCSKKNREIDSDLSQTEDCCELSSSSSENDVISSREKSRSVMCTSHGSTSVIGRRREMEDAVTVELGFLSKDSREYDFFGVYDGHGGSRVAYSCRDRLHWLLVKEIEEEIDVETKSEEDWEKVMVACFGKMDEEVNDITEKYRFHGGGGGGWGGGGGGCQLRRLKSCAVKTRCRCIYV